jgi:hypothetical protein
MRGRGGRIRKRVEVSASLSSRVERKDRGSSGWERMTVNTGEMISEMREERSQQWVELTVYETGKLVGDDWCLDASPRHVLQAGIGGRSSRNRQGPGNQERRRGCRALGGLTRPAISHSQDKTKLSPVFTCCSRPAAETYTD